MTNARDICTRMPYMTLMTYITPTWKMPYMTAAWHVYAGYGTYDTCILSTCDRWHMCTCYIRHTLHIIRHTGHVTRDTRKSHMALACYDTCNTYIPHSCHIRDTDDRDMKYNPHLTQVTYDTCKRHIHVAHGMHIYIETNVLRTTCMRHTCHTRHTWHVCHVYNTTHVPYDTCRLWHIWHTFVMYDPYDPCMTHTTCMPHVIFHTYVTWLMSYTCHIRCIFDTCHIYLAYETTYISYAVWLMHITHGIWQIYATYDIHLYVIVAYLYHKWYICVVCDICHFCLVI